MNKEVVSPETYCRYLKSLHKLGPRINFTLTLVKYYTTLVRTNAPNLTTSVLQDLICLTKQIFTKTTRDDLYAYARILSDEGSFVKTCLFCRISFALLEDETNHYLLEYTANLICHEMLLAIKILLQRCDISADLVQNHFIPFFHYCTQVIQSQPIFAEDYVVQGCFLLHIYFCHELIQDKSGKKETVLYLLNMAPRTEEWDVNNQAILIHKFFWDVISRIREQRFDRYEANIEALVESLQREKIDDMRVTFTEEEFSRYESISKSCAASKGRLSLPTYFGKVGSCRLLHA